jgi:putative endonuclease
MAQHNELGYWGEKVAADLLKSKSYAILDINWKYRKYELDILALFENLLIVVEVKTREHWQDFDPLKSITIAKQKRIIRAAHAYIQEKELTQEVRFDIITVIRKQGVPEITHIPDAFYALV